MVQIICWADKENCGQGKKGGKGIFLDDILHLQQNHQLNDAVPQKNQEVEKVRQVQVFSADLGNRKNKGKPDAEGDYLQHDSQNDIRQEDSLAEIHFIVRGYPS